MDRIPDYLAGDLAGLILEHQFEKEIDQSGLRFNWNDVRSLISPSGRGAKLEVLGIFLENFGVTVLEIDELRHAFERACANRGVIGPKWKRFLGQNFKKRRGPGRPRNVQYDALLQKRFLGSRAISYGQLARELSDAIPKDQRVNWLKSAESYRRKKLRATSK